MGKKNSAILFLMTLSIIAAGTLGVFIMLRQQAPPPKQAVAGLVSDGAGLVINEATFYGKMLEFWNEPGKNVGREIQVVGFVYRQGNSPEDRALVGRKRITCCEDDAVDIGFLFSHPDARTIDTGTWVFITGRVVEVEHGSRRIDMIEADTITKVERPSNPFVF